MGRGAGDGVEIIVSINGGGCNEIADVAGKFGVLLAVGDVKPMLEVSNSRLVALRSFCSLFLSASFCFFSSVVLPAVSVFTGVVFTTGFAAAGIVGARLRRMSGKGKNRSVRLSVSSSVFYGRGGRQ